MGGEKNRAPDSFKLWQPPHTEDEKNQLALWSNKTDIHSNMRHLRGDHMPCNNLVLRWENLREQTYCIFFFFFFLASNEGGKKKKRKPMTQEEFSNQGKRKEMKFRLMYM